MFSLEKCYYNKSLISTNCSKVTQKLSARFLCTSGVQHLPGLPCPHCNLRPLWLGRPIIVPFHSHLSHESQSKKPVKCVFFPWFNMCETELESKPNQKVRQIEQGLGNGWYSAVEKFWLHWLSKISDFGTHLKILLITQEPQQKSEGILKLLSLLWCHRPVFPGT